jgi:hypothetical protein
MTHTEFVEELIVHIAEMLERYEINNSISLAFDASIELEVGRMLTVKLIGDEDE